MMYLVVAVVAAVLTAMAYDWFYVSPLRRSCDALLNQNRQAADAVAHLVREREDKLRRIGELSAALEREVLRKAPLPMIRPLPGVRSGIRRIERP